MLISHKHRFIFVHIYKNAGTSITSALLPFAARNKAHFLMIRLMGKLKLRLPANLNPAFMADHSSAGQIIERIGLEKFDEYFSFAFVRNPWDWQVSLYNFMRKNEKHHQHKLSMSFKNFDDYIAWRCNNEVRFQKSFIFSEDNKQQVDFIGKYEELNADFANICRRLEIQASLPTLNVSKTRPYQSYYNAKTIELVRETFAPDILAFNYAFE